MRYKGLKQLLKRQGFEAGLLKALLTYRNSGKLKDIYNLEEDNIRRQLIYLGVCRSKLVHFEVIYALSFDKGISEARYVIDSERGF